MRDRPASRRAESPVDCTKAPGSAWTAGHGSRRRCLPGFGVRVQLRAVEGACSIVEGYVGVRVVPATTGRHAAKTTAVGLTEPLGPHATVRLA